MESRELLEIIKCILNGKTECAVFVSNWRSIILTAQRHSLVNALACGVSLLPPESKPEVQIEKYLQETFMVEIAKEENQLYAAEEMQRYFEENGIYCIALKGINTKKRYPQARIRTMGDIDILYKPSQHREIGTAMAELHYEKRAEGRKHDHYSRAPFVNVEMHRELVASDSAYSDYYADFWNRCNPKENHTYVYEMSLEDEFLFNIIHLTEHFKKGGIGIRFIMDIYVYNHLDGMNFVYLREELKKLKLDRFYDRITSLAEKWFGDDSVPEDDTLRLLEEFVLENGTFGNQENAADLAVSEEGRGKFLLKVCFPNLKSMQSMYPWLERYPILLPYSWVHRGIKSAIFRRQNVQSQFKKAQTGNKKRGKELRKFYEACGL